MADGGGLCDHALSWQAIGDVTLTYNHNTPDEEYMGKGKRQITHITYNKIFSFHKDLK